MKRVKDSNLKNHQKGQTTLEMLLLMVVLFVATTVVLDFMGPRIHSDLVAPLHKVTGDTVRFGNYKKDGSPIDQTQVQVDNYNPFNEVRNEPLHH